MHIDILKKFISLYLKYLGSSEYFIELCNPNITILSKPIKIMNEDQF